MPSKSDRRTRTSPSFWRDQRGVVAIILALSLMPLMLAGGIAIDVRQLFNARQVLQQAVDAAAMAAAADNSSLSSAEATAIAQDFLNVNLDLNGVTVDSATISSDPATGIVSVNVKATVPTYFMKLAGLEARTLEITSDVERGKQGPIDLVLVLDVTASMASRPAGESQTKIETLKEAAKDLVNEVFDNDSDKIEVGVVPYSDYIAVSVAPSNSSDPDQGSVSPVWVQPTLRTYQQCIRRVSAWPNCPTVSFDCLVDGIFTVNGCTRIDCGPCLETETRSVLWGGSGSGSGSGREIGCIAPRTVGLDGRGTDAFLRTISNPTAPPYPASPVSSPCSNAVMPLTSRKADVIGKIDSLRLEWETYIPGGLTWGWNVLSPEAPFTARTMAELNEVGGRKAMVLMTDGVNSMSPRLSDGRLLQNGHAALSRDWRDGTKSNELIRDLCENIKQDNIHIYTVLFDVQDATIAGIMQNCATQPSMAFRASDRDGLLQAFRDIADQLKSLKLVN